jgi:aminoglycoside phosphotransferase (APT) family kinase protein
VANVSTLPVPEPVFADAEAGVLAYFRLPGAPLMYHPVAEPALLAPALGGFLGRLHRAPLEEIEHLVERDAYPLEAWLEDAERDYREIAEQVPAADRSLVEDCLERTPPAEPRAAMFCHNDLGAEHVLVDVKTNTVTGVIDWADAAVSDPARDLALVYRDLGPEVFELTLAYYGKPFDDADRERALFYARCKLIEDVAYRLGSPGAQCYAEAGFAHLAPGPSGTSRRA